MNYLWSHILNLPPLSVASVLGFICLILLGLGWRREDKDSRVLQSTLTDLRSSIQARSSLDAQTVDFLMSSILDSERATASRLDLFQEDLELACRDLGELRQDFENKIERDSNLSPLR